MPMFDFARCWDSVDESLTADRLDRIHQVLHGKKAGPTWLAASSDDILSDVI